MQNIREFIPGVTDFVLLSGLWNKYEEQYNVHPVPMSCLTEGMNK